MAPPTGPTSLTTRKLITTLKKTGMKEKVNTWKAVAEQLQRPTRIRREVSLFTLNQHTKEGEIVVVPGKVLANGNLTKKITVAAFKFSAEAKEKINKIGKAITIQELLKEQPKAKNVRIIG